MPQEAKAPGNAGDMLTWGRYARRHRCRRREGLRQAGWALAHSGLRTGRNVHLQTCSCQAPGASNRLQWRACDRGSCTEEPDEGKLSRPVRERRWGGRPPHRVTQADTLRFAPRAADAPAVRPLGKEVSHDEHYCLPENYHTSCATSTDGLVASRF